MEDVGTNSIGGGLMVIGVDLDGVLANFNAAYTKLIKDFTGIELPKDGPDYPTSWCYEREAGVTKAQEDRIWKEGILSSPTFWYQLPAYAHTPNALYRLLTSFKPVYFITSRSGKNCQAQSAAWVRDQWFSYSKSLVQPLPAVCVVPSHKNKIDVLKGLAVTHYIDDRLDTMYLMATQRLNTKLFLLDQPWNRNDANEQSIIAAQKNDEWNYKRIKSVEEFLTEVGV
jgi:hypothetical protein